VSHIPLRKEKDCLNCGAEVQGRYCQDCGQENIVPHETFWHMVTHFFYDITHFDSKFFETVKDLLFKPGFLTKQYVLGKRAAYLHPIKMYVFTSAVFFLLFFSLFKPDANFTDTANREFNPEKRKVYINQLREKIAKDTSDIKLKSMLYRAMDTTRPLTVKEVIDSGQSNVEFNFINTDFHTIKEYDSAQANLSKTERDGWLRNRLIKKQIRLEEEFRSDPAAAGKKLYDSILHKLPYMLFVSLPLFALLLKLVYIRRKNFYYADHGIFTIHIYVFTFILLLVLFSFGKLQDIVNFKFFGVVVLILLLLLFFYLYKGMRNFYGQRRAKTFFKFLLVAFFSLVMMLVLFLLFTFFSAFTF
jgi:hypothetical protein